MTLTKISQQKRNIENVNLFLDDEFWCSISKDQLIAFGLHKGLKITEKTKTEIENESGLNKIKEAIIKYVSYRPRSEKEIRDNLVLKKGKDVNLVDAMLLKMREDNSQLVDDKFFAKWFAENRMNHGTHGPQKIKAELFKKGIDSKIINSVLKEIENREEMIEIKEQKIKDFIAKKKGKIKAKNDFERKQKLSQALMRKGFNYNDFKDLL